MSRRFLLLLCLLVAALVTTGCDDDDDNNGPSATSGSAAEQEGSGDSNDGDGDGADGGTTAQEFMIAPGDSATEDALAAFIKAGPGDTITFECGFYEFDTGLVLQDTEGVTIRGCGREKTVLSFNDSDTAEGFLISNARGITVEDLTVTDTPGDGIKIKSSDIVTYRNVRTMWSSADNRVTASNFESAIHYECPMERRADFTYAPDSDNGRYGIYPVQTTNVLLDNVESLGASDAGIYVGQSDDIIVKNSRALYNVAGFEFENTQRAEMFDNVAECNTVGYIVYDLPFLSQYGSQARMHDNMARNNNFENFASGGIVSQVPSGSGLITLAYDQVEINNNTFKDHKTASVIITSYELIGDDGDNRQDIYTEALHIHDNEFINSGYNPPPPDLEKLGSGDVSTLLPTIIRLKNLLVGADILWDGLYDEPRPDCAYPTDADGNRLPADDRGKPQFEGTDVQPDCRFNQYKFDDDSERKKPSMFICIENNTFTGSPLAPEFANFHGLQGLEVLDIVTDPAGQLQNGTLLSTLRDQVGNLGNLVADRDLTPHQCVAQYGETLPSMEPVTLETYTLPTGGTGEPTDEEVAELCGRDTDGAINREALARVDCPNLASYNLFDDPTNPSENANGNGMIYDLNTRLFSDYAAKYRFVFLPPGEAAQYRGANEGENETYVFPVGTIISKTFSFPDERDGTIDHVETRLLIKRQDDDGTEHWAGLPYIWEDGANGERMAKLSLGGGTASASWYYHDRDSGELHEGSTDNYDIPHANQCVTCHSNTHRTAGSAPIGLKPRNLNKPYPYESGKQNQIAHWVDNGMLIGAPNMDLDPNTQIATNIPRIPHFNVPGDSGFPMGSDKDVEARVRGYLEVNCAHCHNPGGAASNTGLFLDTLREVDASYGICKTPTAAGGGSGGRPSDITPSSAMDSILPFRMNSNDTEARMPPIARSVKHQQAVDLVRDWINTVVDSDYANGDSCSGGGGGLLGGLLGGR